MLLNQGAHHGYVQRRVDFPEFSVLSVAYSPNSSTRPHAHENAMFCTTLSGSSVERQTGVSAYMPRYDKHADVIGPSGWNQVILEISPGYFQIGDPQRARRCDAPALFQTAGALQRALRRPLAEDNRFVRALTQELLACDFLLGASTERKSPVWLRHAQEYIEANFRTRPSLETIACAISVHPIHLAREYRRWNNFTVAHAVRQRIVTEALRLVIKEDVPAGVVAGMYGYTASHFSQLIQRETGYRLKQLRARAKRDLISE